MLMDVIMESLMSMDGEALESAIDGMTDEELEIVNGYLDDLRESGEDDVATEQSEFEYGKSLVNELMSLDEDSLMDVIESTDDSAFENMETICEKAINFDQTVYNTRNNPAKFVITPNVLCQAGIPDDRANELFDTLCDYMAEKKYITWGRKELPEKIATHFKEVRKITASEITEFGWRYFKKAKALMLKSIKSGGDGKNIMNEANMKALSSANAGIVGKAVLDMIGYIFLVAGTITALSVGIVKLGADPTAVYNTATVSSGVSTAYSGVQVARDYSMSKNSLNKVASRA